MDTMGSFKGYGKVDPLEEAAFKRKTRRRKIIVGVSLVLFIVLIIGVVVGKVAHNKNKEVSEPAETQSASMIRYVCNVTHYPESCLTSLNPSNTSDLRKIFQFSLKVVMDSLDKLSTFPEEYANRTNDPWEKEALKICGEVLKNAAESLNDCISSTEVAETMHFSHSVIDDLRTWLSAVITDQETCFDALEEANATFVDEIKLLMKNSTEFASNSLAIVTKLLGALGDFKIPNHRRLQGFPRWITAGDRRLLQSSNPKPNVTVAKDGSGDVRTINEAAARIPKKNNKTRFVIYVKAGLYVENVTLDSSLWNVMIYGEGASSTIISGSKNKVDGTGTYHTSTFTVEGKNFIAKDLAFMNTAGPSKNQAVALRSDSDFSVFYRCTFDAFQDTLYAHSKRQFYRECNITGTIDFIFGNAIVVFQKCNIFPRQPLPGQYVTITAQSKNDSNENTGISIQRCIISPLDNLTAPTYLGRPWGNYSTTVIMQTHIGDFLEPKGWSPWDPNVDPPPRTIFYAEFNNTGPGATIGNRVNWTGYWPNITEAQASNFSVKSFIDGASWLPATNVTFDST